METLREVYSTFFMLLDVKSIMPDGETMLETQTKKRGRPKKRRIRSQGEEDPEKRKTCSRCKGKGHYASTCVNEIEERTLTVASQVISQNSQGNAVEGNAGAKKARKQYACKSCGLPGHNKATCKQHTLINGLLKSSSLPVDSS